MLYFLEASSTFHPEPHCIATFTNAEKAKKLMNQLNYEEDILFTDRWKIYNLRQNMRIDSVGLMEVGEPDVCQRELKELQAKYLPLPFWSRHRALGVMYKPNKISYTLRASTLPDD